MEPDSQRDCIPLMVCSECKKTVPSLRLCSTNDQIKFCVNCFCSNGTNRNNLKQFVKRVTFTETQAQQCETHLNRKGDQYCFECSCWLCSKCLKYHSKFAKKHILIEPKPEKNCLKRRKLPQNNLIDKVIEKNKKTTNRLIERIDQEIKRLIQMKAYAQSAYYLNKSVNEELKQLNRTSFSCKQSLSSGIMTLQKVMGTNQMEDDSGDDVRIEEEFNQLEANFQIKDHLIQTSRSKCSDTFIEDTTVFVIIQLKDGRLASGLSNNSINLWDLKTKECSARLIKHTDYVKCLFELADGRLASGSKDTTIRLWNTTLDECELTLRGHNSIVLCVIELHDGTLASSSGDKTIKLWKCPTFELEATLIGQDSWIYELIQLIDGRLASCSGNRIIKIWNLKTFECTATLKGHSKIIMSLIELDDGRIVSGSVDNSIRVWDPNTNECIATLVSEMVWALVKMPLSRFASGTKENTICIWDAITLECEVTLKGHSDEVYCLAALHDGRLASGSKDSSIRIWDLC